MYYRLSYFS